MLDTVLLLLLLWSQYIVPYILLYNINIIYCKVKYYIVYFIIVKSFTIYWQYIFAQPWSYIEHLIKTRGISQGDVTMRVPQKVSLTSTVANINVTCCGITAWASIPHSKGILNIGIRSPHITTLRQAPARARFEAITSTWPRQRLLCSVGWYSKLSFFSVEAIKENRTLKRYIEIDY